MTLAEASRQYQAALEADRRIRTELTGTLSAEDELRDAASEVMLARETMEHAFARAVFAGLPVIDA